MRAIASEPSHRWQTARQMQEALEAWIAQSGPPVTPADLAALLHERTGTPASGATPIGQPHHNTSIMGASPPRVAQQPHQMPSGTRRREEPPKGTSWSTIILAMVTGLVLGLLVLRSVYNARRSHMLQTPPTPSGSLGETIPSAAPISTTVVAPGQNTVPSDDQLELPATPRPSAAPKPAKPAAPALPPNPYE